MRLAEGLLKQVYIDRSELDPGGYPIRVLVDHVKNPHRCKGVTINGPSKVAFDPIAPLWSSARVWVETNAEVILDLP